MSEQTSHGNQSWGKEHSRQSNSKYKGVIPFNPRNDIME